MGGALDAGGLAGLAGGGGGGGGGGDLSGGLGGDAGFNPFDPSSMFGGGGGGDLSGGFGGFDSGAFPDMGGGVDPTGSFGAQQAIQGPQGFQQGATPQGDQPGAPSGPQQQQQPQQQPQQQQAQQPELLRDIAHAFQYGSDSISGTPGDARAQVSGPTMTDAGNQMGMGRQASVNFEAIDPSQSVSRKGPSIQLMDPKPSIELPELNQGAAPPATTGAAPPATRGTAPPSTEGAASDYAPSVTNTDTNYGNLINPQAAGGAAPVNAPATPDATASAGTGNTAPPADQSGAAGPATQAGGQQPGMRAPQSPLEQIVSRFLPHFMQMILSGGRGVNAPLSQAERALAQMLGIPIPPQLNGNPFNRPVPPGYYPPGTQGGTQPNQSQPPGAPPSRAPGPPGIPGNQPSALPPGRKLSDTSLPGGPYTATDPNQPPPWAAGQAGAGGGGTLQPNQIMVPRGAQRPSMRPTQPSVDRSSFQPQVQNPAMVQRLAWMVNGEVGKNAPTHAKIVQLETVFNRAYQRGQNLTQALQLHSRSPQGYYANDTYSRAAIPSSQELERFKAQVLDPVMRGSNLSDVGYGPMTGNASGGTAGRQFMRGQQGYHLQGGDSYFREGPFNRPFPVLQGM